MSDAAPSNLSRHSTSDELADVLRERIMTGDLAPDAAMRETALSEQFGVSRRTVREALRVLEHEGIVRHHRHKGTRVTLFDAEDIHDLYRTRRTLELAAVPSAHQAPRERVQAVRVAFDLLAEATRNGDAADVVHRDLEFHQSIVGLLDSARLDRFLRATSVEMRYALALLEAATQESTRRPDAALDEHRAIRDALMAGDRRLASRLIATHLDVNERVLVHVVAGA